MRKSFAITMYYCQTSGLIFLTHLLGYFIGALNFWCAFYGLQNIVSNYFEFITLSMSIHNLNIRIAVQFFSKL